MKQKGGITKAHFPLMQHFPIISGRVGSSMFDTWSKANFRDAVCHEAGGYALRSLRSRALPSSTGCVAGRFRWKGGSSSRKWRIFRAASCKPAGDFKHSPLASIWVGLLVFLVQNLFSFAFLSINEMISLKTSLFPRELGQLRVAFLQSWFSRKSCHPKTSSS